MWRVALDFVMKGNFEGNVQRYKPICVSIIRNKYGRTVSLGSSRYCTHATGWTGPTQRLWDWREEI